MSWYSIVRRGGTTSTPWDPSQLTDLIAWWKFDELTGTNGSSVTSVTDSAGSYDLSDYNGGPTLVTSAQNGLNAVGFSNSTLVSASAYGGGDSGFSVFVAAKRGSAAVNQQLGGGANKGHLMGSNSGSRVWLRAYMSDGSRYQDENFSHPGWSGSWDIVGFSADFASGTFDTHFDGSNIGSQTGLATGTSQGHTFTIGYFFGAPWQGELGEYLIVTNSLSLSDRQRVEGYLAHKWGLTANLPVAHPYKTTAPTA